MKRREAEIELAKLIGCESVWFNETENAEEFANDGQELSEWLDGLDDQVVVKEFDDDIDGYKVKSYGVSDDRCVSGCIIFNNVKEVMGFGYTED